MLHRVKFLRRWRIKYVKFFNIDIRFNRLNISIKTHSFFAVGNNLTFYISMLRSWLCPFIIWIALQMHDLLLILLQWKSKLMLILHNEDTIVVCYIVCFSLVCRLLSIYPGYFSCGGKIMYWWSILCLYYCYCRTRRCKNHRE